VARADLDQSLGIYAGLAGSDDPAKDADVSARANLAIQDALAAGITLRNNEVNDDERGLVASGELNPAKSRVLLQLALTKTSDPVRIQQIFYEY